MKKIVVIGAGPAGLTAAYELSKNKEYEIIILEETEEIGGISKTVNYNGNRMDMGGHRFFSKIPEVNKWWEEIMPLKISQEKSMKNVLLIRDRLSRILFNHKFYDYPIKLSMSTIKNMGFINTVCVGISYIAAKICKKEENSLENFYINRFGKKLYTMFFEYYTENLWGRHPRDIDPSWGSQRVKGLSIMAIIKDVFCKGFGINHNVETSLIEKFKYPKYGPGQMWTITAEKIKENGGKVLLNAKVVNFIKNNNKITDVIYEKDGRRNIISADYVISSMPVKDLIFAMDNVPDDIIRISKGLPYRDYMILGVLIKGKLNLPDTWIYVQDRSVRLGRIQIFNNWSPYLVKDQGTTWLGLEYFVNEGDEFWTMSEDKFSEYALSELMKLDIISSKDDVIDIHLEHIKKAYPAYFDTYADFDKIKKYLNDISNLYCVGRNGQHRYNNMDHSMMTAFIAADMIKTGKTDKSDLWNVNTEKDYHETS